MHQTRIVPFIGEAVYIARDRKAQRALMRFLKPENYFTVRAALIQADRGDLIGGGCDCLIPAQPPREVIEARRKRMRPRRGRLWTRLLSRSNGSVRVFGRVEKTKTGGRRKRSGFYRDVTFRHVN